MEYKQFSMTASSVDEYIKYTSRYKLGTGYRGVSKTIYDLIPSAGRPTKYTERNEVLRRERNMFYHFKQHAYLHCGKMTSMEAAVMGQHYGLPTRLLDWTLSPLIALYFAVKDNFGDDSKVYITDITGSASFFSIDDIDYNIMFFDFTRNSDEYKDFLKSKHYIEKDPNSLENYQNYIGEKFINPKPLLPNATTSRIASQGSFFTLHYNPYNPMRTSLVDLITIKKENKEEILNHLGILGVHAYSICPDLEGLAQWQRQRFFED